MYDDLHYHTHTLHARTDRHYNIAQQGSTPGGIDKQTHTELYLTVNVSVPVPMTLYLVHTATATELYSILHSVISLIVVM